MGFIADIANEESLCLKKEIETPRFGFIPIAY